MELQPHIWDGHALIMSWFTLGYIILWVSNNIYITNAGIVKRQLSKLAKTKAVLKCPNKQNTTENCLYRKRVCSGSF